MDKEDKKPDKRWISPKKEEERAGERYSPRGVVDIEETEEGKTSSGSKVHKEVVKTSKSQEKGPIEKSKGADPGEIVEETRKKRLEERSARQSHR